MATNKKMNFIEANVTKARTGTNASASVALPLSRRRIII
jgi:hypothetical protein